MDATFVFVEASCATPAATATVTAPFAAGVTLTVYTVLLTATKVPAVPLVTVISPKINPVTALLKVMVTGIGLVAVEAFAVDETTTEGRLLSNDTLKVFDTRLLFAAASCATPAAALTVTVPVAVGVMDAV